MWPSVVQFLLAAVAIVVGGIGLSRSAEAISRITGMGPLLAGALLLATATSLPDLVTGISAARQGWVDLTVGDLVGAALMNLLILALMDLRHQARGRMLSQAAASHALSGMMSITLLAITGIALVLPESMDFTIAGIGVGLWCVGVAYFLGLRLVFFDQRFAARQIEAAAVKAEDHDKHKKETLTRPTIVYVIAAVLILIAGPQLAEAANDLAQRTGLGNTFFGTAFLPLCTTLPEFAVAVTAMRMGAFNLVVGNAFGSVSFNLLLLLAIDLAYDGSLMVAASPTHVVTCLAAILTIAIAVMGQLYHAERRRRLVEPDAWLIIVLVFVAFAIIYFLR